MKNNTQKEDIENFYQLLNTTKQNIANLTLALAEIPQEEAEARDLILEEIIEQENIKHSILLSIELLNNKQSEPPVEFGK